MNLRGDLGNRCGKGPETCNLCFITLLDSYLLAATDSICAVLMVCIFMHLQLAMISWLQHVSPTSPAGKLQRETFE
jgi:hypothetical protein